MHVREMVLWLLAGKETGLRNMYEDGAFVRAGAVRALERSVTLFHYDHLRGQPHDPTGTIREVQRDAGRGVGSRWFEPELRANLKEV